MVAMNELGSFKAPPVRPARRDESTASESPSLLGQLKLVLRCAGLSHGDRPKRASTSDGKQRLRRLAAGQSRRCARSPRGTLAIRALLPLLLSLSLAGQAVAQQGTESPNADEARRAIGQLRSPYCPGAMLETCSSAQGAALRDSIYDLAAEGMSSGEIVEWMLGRHGEEYRALPERAGAGLWAWVIPPLALLAGLAIIVVWLRSSRGAEPPAAPPSTLSQGEREKLAHALREWQDSGEEEI